METLVFAYFRTFLNIFGQIEWHVCFSQQIFKTVLVLAAIIQEKLARRGGGGGGRLGRGARTSLKATGRSKMCDTFSLLIFKVYVQAGLLKHLTASLNQTMEEAERRTHEVSVMSKQNLFYKNMKERMTEELN